MKATALLDELRGRGGQLTADGERLRFRFPRGCLTPLLREAMADNKEALLTLLRQELPPAQVAAVAINGRSFSYEKSWSGRRLPGNVIALDTETPVIAGVAIPSLALASASSGATHCLIHPDRVGEFVLAHRDSQFVFHNVAFDFWVIARHLELRNVQEALAVWWDLANANRIHDTMILDMLLRLARSDAFPRPRDLGILAAEYAGLEINKEDPFRMRYGEIIGVEWTQVERGFFDYAIKDPIATWHAYERLGQEVGEIAREAGVTDGTIAKYGPLTEAVQVKGAIALAQVSRNGLNLDLAQSAAVHDRLKDSLAEIVGRLQADPQAADLFNKDKKSGKVLMTPSHTPSLKTKVLQNILTGIATSIATETGQAVKTPLTKKGAVSTSTKEWADLAHLNPFLQDWAKMAEAAKLCQFFGALKEQVIHPQYTVMVRTGRTSCRGPNIQQIPRKGGLREIFVAPPGYLLLTVDYGFIELRTLAAVCEERYGKSKLAEVIRDGIDPHSYTASMLLNKPLTDFMKLKEDEPERYKQLRQQAKPLNFGIPGGLGPASLVRYAHATYGVELTLDQAKEFRDRLINQVYPELGDYLSEDGMTILAKNLNVSQEVCWQQFDWSNERSATVVGALRNIVRGKTKRADGKPYSPRWYNGVWDGLIAINRNNELSGLLAKRTGNEELCKKLFHGGVTTQTGRIRGWVNFSQARNTPFQGLAADGAKLALWELVRAGFRVVGFVHDEILVELPDQGGYVDLAQAKKVEDIMCRSMEQVTGSVPVACDYALAECWSKEAKALVEGDRLIPWRRGPANEKGD